MDNDRIRALEIKIWQLEHRLLQVELDHKTRSVMYIAMLALFAANIAITIIRCIA